MVVATSLLGFITKAFSAFSRIDRPHIAWTSVTMAIFALLTCAYVSPTPASATAGINRQINFQGRLLNSQGATVPDGFYNIQFKIYQDGPGTAVGNPGGTLMWTESHLNNNSQGVTVKNGFLSVQLGSINAFGSQIDWNQDTIWLSMNIGSTNATCTPFSNCAPDGEMVPMKRMTATPYALNSGLLNGLASSNFVQLAQGVQTDATVGTSSIFINKTVAGNLLQLQSSGSDVFTVSNAGDLTFGANANHTLSIATAGAGIAGKTLTMAAGAGGSGTGSAGGDLVLAGGAAGGTDGNGGNITINAGAKTGTGTDGTISIGTANTSGIVLGQNTTLAAGKSLTITGGTTGTRPSSPTEGMVYYDTDTKQLLTYANGKWQADHSEAVLVAANDSSPAAKAAADYIADGTADQVEINNALTEATTATGSNLGSRKVYLFAGTYTTADTISIPNDTTLVGAGKGTLIQFGNLGGVSKNMITNTTTGGSGTGIAIRDLKLDGNKTTNSTDTFTGIYLDGAGSSSTNLPGATIANVAVQNFENNGIHLTNSANNIITGNTIQSNDDHGIFTNTATTGNHDLITNNTITGNTLNGIYLNATVRSNVSDNFIGSNGNYGIRIESGSNNTINSNVLRSNTGSGSTSSIHVIGGGGTEAHLITGNNITDTAGTGYAINLVDAAVDGVYLSNNTFSGTGSSTINDASGGDTIYSGQSNGNSYLVQPVDDFSITGNAASTISTTAGDLTMQGGSGTVTLGTSTNLTAGGALAIASAASTALTLTSNAAATWGTTAGNLTIDAGATLNLGTANATGLSLSKAGSTTTVNGALTLVTGQNLTVNGDVINDLTGSGLTISGSALTVDASSATGFFRNGGNSFGTGATLGTNDSNNLAIRTDSTTRATFDTSNNLYLGNGTSSLTPSSFTVQGTTSSATGVTGGSLTIQGGGANTGNANGGNLTLSGGTGVGTGANGLVILTTTTMQTTNDGSCYLVASSCTITSASLNNNSAIVIGFTADGQTATLPAPPQTTAGRLVYITAANTSKDFTLSVNGGGAGNLIAMRQNTTATMIWNGTAWTAAGASSSTTLQSAYDNTLQSAGGAELVVGKTSNTNGLTIRDSSINPVNGALLSVQSSSAAGLLSVNSNLNEYASNAGAETAGGTSSTFPASTWAAIDGNTTVSRYTTAGPNIATGQASVSAVAAASANTGIKNTLTSALTANNHYNVSFTAKLASGTFTDMNVIYSIDGTTTGAVTCEATQAIATSVWTKVNCAFTAPASGITASNAIFIRQTGAAAHTFYVDNLSVTIAADYNLATDGGVDDSTNFTTNWNAVPAGGTVTRETNIGNDASSSAKIVTVATADQGVRNKLSIKPLASTPGTLYRITAYVATTTAGFNSFTVGYSLDGTAGTVIPCVDYNTQAIANSTSDFTKVTCYVTTNGTAPSNPYIFFSQGDATARTFYVDTFSMTLASDSTPNVQVGGGINGGPTTLFTLDRGASAPIAGDNDALLGSMYYDTTLGKLQCYEADGWGACGSSPDQVVTLAPEFANAVMHGTGVGTMVSDICSDALNINDGSSGQPTICGTNETYNFYRWTSPQASAQSYGIYVTYQLPSTFKSFASGQTSIMGRTDSSNATVSYQIYRSDGSGLTACGSAVTVSTGTQSSWQTGTATGASDPSTCGFAPGNSIVYKINVTTSQNANAYVGNLNFTFSNR